MKLVLHIVGKDLRRLRWWLLAWVGTLALPILVGVRLPNAAPVRTSIGRFGEYMKFTQLISWLLSASERGSAIVSKPADALASLPRKAEDESQR